MTSNWQPKSSSRAKDKAISSNMCKQAIEKFAVRLNECVIRNGGHIEHVL